MSNFSLLRRGFNRFPCTTPKRSLSRSTTSTTTITAAETIIINTSLDNIPGKRTSHSIHNYGPAYRHSPNTAFAHTSKKFLPSACSSHSFSTRAQHPRRHNHARFGQHDATRKSTPVSGAGGGRQVRKRKFLQTNKNPARGVVAGGSDTYTNVTTAQKCVVDQSELLSKTYEMEEEYCAMIQSDVDYWKIPTERLNKNPTREDCLLELIKNETKFNQALILLNKIIHQWVRVKVGNLDEYPQRAEFWYDCILHLQQLKVTKSNSLSEKLYGFFMPESKKPTNHKLANINHNKLVCALMQCYARKSNLQESPKLVKESSQLYGVSASHQERLLSKLPQPPDPLTLKTLLVSYAGCRSPTAAKKARALKSTYALSDENFFLVMQAHVSAISQEENGCLKYIEEMMEDFFLMRSGDNKFDFNRMYNVVLKGYSNAKATKKATKLYEKMKKEGCVNYETHQIMGQFYVQSGNLDLLHKACSEILPLVHREQRTNLCNSILRAMCQFIREPTNHVLKRRIADMALGMLNGEPPFHPSYTTISLMLQIIKVCRIKNAGSVAETLLSDMELLYLCDQIHTPPDMRLYRSAFSCWITVAEMGVRNAAGRSVELLWRMEGMSGASLEGVIPHENSMKPFFAPHAYCQDLKPTVQTYNAVLQACAVTTYKGDKPTSVDLAMQVYDRMTARHGIHPNSVTYSIMFRSLSNVNDTDISGDLTVKCLSKKLLKDACHFGQVNPVVLKSMMNACSSVYRAYEPKEEDSVNAVDINAGRRKVSVRSNAEGSE